MIYIFRISLWLPCGKGLQRDRIEAEKHPEAVVVIHISDDGGSDEHDNNKDGVRRVDLRYLLEIKPQN